MDAKVQRTLGGALTVGELIEILQGCPEDARIVFTCDYGDYGHTQQALPVRAVGSLDEQGGTLQPSGYSQSGLAISRSDDEDDEDADRPATDAESGPDVIVLSM